MEWEPKEGDRVWVTGGNMAKAGTIRGFAKDDPTVPWIECDDGMKWDARDVNIRPLDPKDDPKKKD